MTIAFAIPNLQASANWINVSNVNNEPEYWDVSHVKYSVMPNNGGVIMYINIKSEYTYYKRTFGEKASTTIGVSTQIYNTFIYDLCSKYKDHKTAASSPLATHVTDTKTLCSMSKGDVFYQIIYQGGLLIQNGKIYLISPPLLDLYLVMYVNNQPTFDLVTKADPTSAKTINLYDPSSAKPDLQTKYNRMVDIINDYILPELNSKNNLHVPDLEHITQRTY